MRINMIMCLDRDKPYAEAAAGVVGLLHNATALARRCRLNTPG